MEKLNRQLTKLIHYAKTIELRKALLILIKGSPHEGYVTQRYSIFTAVLVTTADLIYCCIGYYS